MHGLSVTDMHEQKRENTVKAKPKQQTNEVSLTLSIPGSIKSSIRSYILRPGRRIVNVKAKLTSRALLRWAINTELRNNGLAQQ